MFSAPLLIALVSAQAPRYGKCNKDTYNWKPLGTRGFPIVPALSQGAVTVSGEVYIIDGCTFGTRNFVFINGGESYWYGGYKGSSDGLTLSTTVVASSANPANFTFQLRQDAGAEANFNGFNQFRLFERANNRLLATVDIPDSVSPTSSIISRQSTSTSTSTSTPTSTNSASVESYGISTITSFLFALLFA